MKLTRRFFSIILSFTLLLAVIPAASISVKATVAVDSDDFLANATCSVGKIQSEVTNGSNSAWKIVPGTGWTYPAFVLDQTYSIKNAKLVMDIMPVGTSSFAVQMASLGNTWVGMAGTYLTADKWTTMTFDIGSNTKGITEISQFSLGTLVNASGDYAIYIDNVRLEKSESATDDWINVSQDKGSFYYNVTSEFSEEYVKATDSVWSLKVTAPEEANGTFALNTEGFCTDISSTTFNCYVYFGAYKPGLSVQLTAGSWGASAPLAFTFVDCGDGWYYGTLNTSDIVFYNEGDTCENVIRIKFIVGAGKTIYIDGLICTQNWLDEGPVIQDYAYAVAVIGDTQIITEHYPEELPKIYDWITANAEEKNIQFVMGLGDITNSNTDTEWQTAMDAISAMDGVVDYSLVRGNHDSIAQYNSYITYDKYSSTIGGFYEENMLNTWRQLELGGNQYLLLCLDWGPSDDVLAWAGDVIKAHPENKVIITTHCYLWSDGSTHDQSENCPPIGNGGYNNGNHLWDKFISQYENIQLVLCGHVAIYETVVVQTEGVHGNPITQIMVNYQELDRLDRPSGMVAILYFSADGSIVQMETYSPIQEQWYIENNQRTIDLNTVSSYAVTFHANGHGSTPITQVIRTGFKAQEPEAPTASGYVFQGWYTDASCKNAYDFEKPVTGSVNLYAKWRQDGDLNDLLTNASLVYDVNHWDNYSGTNTGLTAGKDTENVYGEDSQQSWYFKASAAASNSFAIAQLNLKASYDMTDCYLAFDAKYVSDSPVAQKIELRLQRSSWANQNTTNKVVSLTAGDWNTYYLDFTSVYLENANPADLAFISFYFDFAANTGYERTVYIDNVRLVKMETAEEDWIHLGRDTGSFYCNSTYEISDRYVKAENSGFSAKVTAPAEQEGKFTYNLTSIAPDFTLGKLNAWFYFGDQTPSATVQVTSSNWKGSAALNMQFTDAGDGWYYGTFDTSSLYFYETAHLEGIIRLSFYIPAGYTIYVDGLKFTPKNVDRWNVVLEDDWKVNFYLTMDSSDRVQITVDDEVRIMDAAQLSQAEDGCYIASASVAAAQMTENIAVQIVGGTAKNYTVQQYCSTILGDESYSQYHAFVKEMLNYGGAAQNYFSHNTDNLANAGITGVASAEIPETAEEMTVSDDIDGLNFYGASLVHRDRIAVRFYFTGDVTGKTFSANGNTYTPIAKDSMYYVEIGDILPQDLDQQITLTVSDADGNTLTVTYGPMNYIVRMNEKGSENTKNLMKALYNYHLAAKALRTQMVP